MCHSTGTPSAASPLVAWNRACGGMRSSRSPWMSRAQAHVQRQHRSLAEADERQRRGRKIAPLEFGVEEAHEERRGFVNAVPAFIGIAEGEREPLPADRRLAAGLRRVRGHEGGLRQESLPGATDIDEVVAVGAIAVQEHDELARGRSARFEARTIELSHCSPPLASVRHRAAWPRDNMTRACRLRPRATGAKLRRAAPSL